MYDAASSPRLRQRIHPSRWFLVLLSFFVIGSAHSSKEVTYYYTDHQGTVLARTDAQGNLLSVSDHRPYGSDSLGASQPGPGYTSHVEDEDVGLIYMQDRYYDPDVGRFISTDAMPFYANEAAFGRFTYVQNNPLTMVDPDGRAGKIAWLVRLTATGMRRIARLTEAEAIAARRAEKNIAADRKVLSETIEGRAFPELEQMEHKGHGLPDGSKGSPHYQTEGKRGHSFWGSISVAAIFVAGTLDEAAEAAEYLPDSVPRIATDEDIDRTNNILDFISKATNVNLPRYRHESTPECDAICYLIREREDGDRVHHEDKK